MAFQRFERGFMLRDMDANCVYVYSEQNQNIVLGPNGSYDYCIEFDSLPDNPGATTAPSGLSGPAGPFGRVWSFYPAVRESLGYATTPEQRYTGQLPPIGPSFGGGPFDTPQAVLPDGRSLYCGMRGATAGRCSIR